MQCGVMGRPPCPGGAGGGEDPPGGGPPGGQRDGLPPVFEEEEEEEGEGGVLFEDDMDEELEWLPHDAGKRIGRIWLKSRGASRCMHCGQDKFVHLCLSHLCQRRNMGIHNSGLPIVVWPQARIRMAKGWRQRELPGLWNRPCGGNASGKTKNIICVKKMKTPMPRFMRKRRALTEHNAAERQAEGGAAAAAPPPRRVRAKQAGGEESKCKLTSSKFEVRTSNFELRASNSGMVLKEALPPAASPLRPGGSGDADPPPPPPPARRGPLGSAQCEAAAAPRPPQAPRV